MNSLDFWHLLMVFTVGGVIMVGIGFLDVLIGRWLKKLFCKFERKGG